MINSDNQNNINLQLSKYQEKSVRQALPMDESHQVIITFSSTAVLGTHVTSYCDRGIASVKHNKCEKLRRKQTEIERNGKGTMWKWREERGEKWDCWLSPQGLRMHSCLLMTSSVTAVLCLCVQKQRAETKAEKCDFSAVKT